MTDADEWQSRVDAVWADDALSDEERIVRIDELATERPAEDAVALFERAGARDSAGREGDAEVLYRRALARGLSGRRRSEARIQLASTLRNLGQVEESLRILDEERQGGELADAAAAFYALALASSGDPTSAASIALETLAPHLPQYTRSVAAYARQLRTAR